MPRIRTSHSLFAVAVLVIAMMAVGPAAEGARAAPTTPTPTPGCGHAWQGGIDVTGTMDSGGVQRTYLLHIPTGYNPTTALPLVLNLPGTGMSGKDEESVTHMSSTADALGFIVVYPLGSGSPLSWNVLGTSDVTFLNELVGLLERRVCVDTTHIAAAGYSIGATMVYHLACSSASWLAAIGPVDSNLPGPQWLCKMSHPTPLIAFAGALDPIVPYNGSGLVPSIPKMIEGWADAVECAGPAKTGFSRGDVVETYYAPCKSGAETELYTVTDGGHQWPGGLTLFGLGHNTQVIDASSLMGQFFSTHPLS